jgi:hypothetical protein
MIQRKQSVFLALAALLAAATWLFPVSTTTNDRAQVVFMTYGLVASDGEALDEAAIKIPFHILLSVVAIALAVSIFLFRNRPRQIRVVRGTYIIVLAVIAFLFISDRSVQAYMAGSGTFDHTYGISFIAPVIVLILAVLAERAIKADEELVRSMDRLR